MKKKNTKDPWPEIVLFGGFILSVIVGILMAKYQKTVEIGILAAVLIGILTTQLSIFLEQKNIQRDLAFDQSLYNNKNLVKAITAIVHAIRIVRRRKWSFVLIHIGKYVSDIKHFAEQASFGRLENLSEEVRQNRLKEILNTATSGQLFKATSYVSIGAWWKSKAGQDYYEANVKAVKRDVEVRRIFITKSCLKDEIKQEVLCQIRDNIKVRIAIEDNISAEHQANYAVLENSISTWSTLTPTAGSSEGHISYSESDIQKYSDLFDRLWNLFAREPDQVWNDIVRSSEGYTIKPPFSSNKNSILSSCVKNYLYAKPRLYDILYRDRPEKVSRLCYDIFNKVLGHFPCSILDLGCGTGALLDILSKTCNDTWGVDGHGPIIEYIKSIRPSLRIKQSDIRSLRLERKFECVLMLGWVLNYATTNRDAELMLESVVSHITSGGLFILELLNGFSLLQRKDLKNIEDNKISDGDLSAKITTKYDLIPLQQVVRRTRYWDLGETENRVEDSCPFRLFFPAEIVSLLERFGFRIISMSEDNLFNSSKDEKECFIVVAKYEENALSPLVTLSNPIMNGL